MRLLLCRCWLFTHLWYKEVKPIHSCSCCQDSWVISFWLRHLLENSLSFVRKAVGPFLVGWSSDIARTHLASSLSFGQTFSWKAPYQTGKNFYEEFSVMTFFEVLGKKPNLFIKKTSFMIWVKCDLSLWQTFRPNFGLADLNRYCLLLFFSPGTPV